jgi:hypothetical protein
MKSFVNIEELLNIRHLWQSKLQFCGAYFWLQLNSQFQAGVLHKFSSSWS